jgi:fatty-acyl-CoA synthase
MLDRVPRLAELAGRAMRPQGWRHAVFADRLGDTFAGRVKTSLPPTSRPPLADPNVEPVKVFGAEVPGTEGRAGMAAVVLHPGKQFDGVSLAKTVHERLPGYAAPLFVRVVDSLEHTSA